MEESVEVENKNYDASCVQFMAEEQSKLSDPSQPVFYVRTSRYLPFVWRLVEAQLKRLEELEYCKVTEYIRPSTGQADPRIKQVNILPAGMQRLHTRTIEQTTVTTTKVTQTVPLADEYWTPQRKRNFSRTDRGNAILTMAPEALISDIKSHIKAILNPNVEKAEMRAHQFWLRYELTWRWRDIPDALRVEAEDCRDLPFQKRSTGSKPT